jgi:hypothetical protein
VGPRSGAQAHGGDRRSEGSAHGAHSVKTSERTRKKKSASARDSRTKQFGLILQEFSDLKKLAKSQRCPGLITREFSDLKKLGKSQQAFAAHVGRERQTITDWIADFADFGKIAESHKAAASHATDFDPPIYNVWKQQDKTAGSKDPTDLANMPLEHKQASDCGRTIAH